MIGMNASIDALVSGFNVPPPQMDGLGYAAQILGYAVSVAVTIFVAESAFVAVRGMAESVRNMYRDHKQFVLFKELQRNPEMFDAMLGRYGLKQNAP
ncbi:hypothetical protein HYV82_02145 [Candidatus Woesearchaeota archaeon]|nr:hypothetical protein [Candidatus Woesearchaeota archaeon]